MCFEGRTGEASPRAFATFRGGASSLCAGIFRGGGLRIGRCLVGEGWAGTRRDFFALLFLSYWKRYETGSDWHLFLVL